MEKNIVKPNAWEYRDTLQTQHRAQAACAATEKRLYALPIIRARAEDYREDLAEIENTGMPLTYRLYEREGMMSIEEICIAQKAELRARLAADEREIRKMDNALKCVKNDAYYPAIPLKYFDGLKDAQIAQELHCDPATVRRNRNRLVKRLAMRLYGVDCL